jgi:hypothetical protein
VEAAPKIQLLRRAGHEVLYEEKPTPASIKLGDPQALLIDLSRMPSHGREVAIHHRGRKSTRHIPIVFVDGDSEKVAGIRKLMPDAFYTTWDEVFKAIPEALSRTPAEPIVPAQMMDRYASRTVAQKLGIKPGTIVTVIDPPRNHAALLGELPEGVQFDENERGPGAITLWFVRDAAGYQQSILKRRSLAKKSKLWIVWPKGEAGKRAGITQNVVRETALAVGLVDYKICAINDAWSAIVFAPGKGS